MMRGTITPAAALAAAFWLVCGAQAQEQKKLVEAGITVWYPAGMEAPAKRVAAIAKESIAPSVELQRRISALLSDIPAMSNRIADLLGADEKADEIQRRLQGYKDKANALVRCFSTIKLVKKAAASTEEGISAGVMHLAYIKAKDEFNLSLAPDLSDQEKVGKSYFPVIVNADGSIRSESKLGEMAVQFLGAGDGVVVAPVHETIGYIMAQELKLYHPLTRWFSEGVSGWIARDVVGKTDAKLGPQLASVVAVSDRSKSLRGKVNLISWLQPPFQNRKSASFDPELEAARTQYSVEMITQLLGNNASALLPKIVNEVKYSLNPDTEAICKGIDKVTGKRFKDVLLTYVPADIRQGIESGEAARLAKDAEALVGKREWAKAVELLTRALEMSPGDVNLRLNLACAQRESGDRVDPEFQVFLVAALLKQGSQPFHLFADTLEGRYVLARLAVLVGNLETARAFLDPLIKQKPDHADAKRLLQEIDRLERAAKGQG